MLWILHISTFIVFLPYVHGDYSADASFNSGQHIYSKADTVTMTCLSVSDSDFFEPTASQKWYKKQQDTWILVGQKDVPAAPFTTDRFSLPFVYDNTKPKSGVLELAISNIDVVDSGDYKCLLENNEQVIESNVIILNVQPGDTGNTAKIGTEVQEANEKYKFNVEAKVWCKASTNTNINNVTLSMMLGNGDITSNFDFAKSVEWIGEIVGLKAPKTSLELTSDSYQPDKTGESTLSCKLSYRADADKKDLAINNIIVVRDETAYLECSSNIHGKANIGQTDVSLTCEVKDHNGDKENLVMMWEFFDGNCTEGTEVSIYSTDQILYHRRADKVGDKFRLTILRVQSSMTKCGSVAKYKATLLPNQFDKENPIASHTVELRIDTTQRYTGSDATGLTAAFLTLFSSILAHVLLL